MTIYDLKPKFQAMLRPCVRKLHALGITPNQVTLFTCLLCVSLGLLVYLCEKNLFFLFPLFFFFRMALNAIDGMLAKEHHMQTKLGAILNEVTDVVSDSFLYYAFIKLSFINSHLLLFTIFFAAITELTGLAAVLAGSVRQYAGPMGKSDRAFIFGVLSLLVSFDVTSEKIYNTILFFVAILLLKTVYNRARNAIQ